MPEEVQITQEGYAQLEQALDKERQRRDETIARMADAMDDAMDLEDRSLNAAQSQLELPSIETRILELEDALTRAIIVAPGDLSSDEVMVGSVVVLFDPDHDRELKVQLVSAIEISTLSEGVTQVSDDSPVGQALQGRHRGETFTVQLESGQVRYTVSRIAPA
ncbi:GreA/GreB family elongation factor [Deinococcus oregonensis]|uniref:GreA/GreB family elongation factor n=1 Tax=Deinococcus oregonensis TaxID=1805970 RepID=A0ABV6B8Z9_9DEIO